MIMFNSYEQNGRKTQEPRRGDAICQNMKRETTKNIQ